MGAKIGASALESLAQRFPQLYIAPAEGAQDAHRLASGRGIAPEHPSLAHFQGSSEDELREVDTPAGPVEVLFLKNRCDFECFLRIVGHRCQPVPIAPSVGAITYRGIADWGAVALACEAFLAAGGEPDAWPEEFARQARVPGAFRAELIVISEGPYSNVPASDTPYAADEWIRVSREIRLHHECAHVVCRRLMPDDIAPLWDEVTADVCGLLCATGRYDGDLAARFLGVSAEGYQGGRLAEYVSDEQGVRMDDVAREVYEAICAIESSTCDDDVAHPFDYVLRLKQQPLLTF